MGMTIEPEAPAEPRIFSFGNIGTQDNPVAKLESVNGQDASSAVVAVSGSEITEMAALPEGASTPTVAPAPLPGVDV